MALWCFLPSIILLILGHLFQSPWILWILLSIKVHIPQILPSAYIFPFPVDSWARWFAITLQLLPVCLSLPEPISTCDHFLNFSSGFLSIFTQMSYQYIEFNIFKMGIINIPQSVLFSNQCSSGTKFQNFEGIYQLPLIAHFPSSSTSNLAATASWQTSQLLGLPQIHSAVCLHFSPFPPHAHGWRHYSCYI